MPDDRHQQAFEVYAAGGTKRTFKQVAEQLGVSDRTVRHWAKEGKWRQRLAEREVQAARQAVDQVIGSATVNATRKRKMVELALMKVIKAISSDKVRIQVGDLDRLLRLQAFLDGDGVVISAEALRQRPAQEVLDAYWEWMHSLSDDELNALIELEKKRKVERCVTAPPQPATSSPPPPIESSPTQGEVHDPAPNPAT